MPLRDHFRPPLDDLTSWEGLHGGWPMVIVQSLADKLPPDYLAMPRVHHGAFVEFDVASYEHEPGMLPNRLHEGGSVATAVWSPSLPTYVADVDLSAIDEYEVRIYDTRIGRRLVAVIEIVSPANKDRPGNRRSFVAKCLAHLRDGVSVVIVDLVTTRSFNLYHDLLDVVGKAADPDTAGPIYAVAVRTTGNNGAARLEAWGQPLAIGKPLPTLPLWLGAGTSIPLDLEASYEATCRDLRIT